MAAPQSTMSGCHPIFRNQPSYTIFHANFEEDPADGLFKRLNEINPYFLEEKQQRVIQNFRWNVLSDPRTNKVIQKPEIDLTQTLKPSLFWCGNIRSKLSKREHLLGLKILRSLHDQTEINEEDSLIWRRQTSKRDSEKSQVLAIVKKYSDTNKEMIYEPARILIKLYKEWYERKTESLLRKLPNYKFINHVAVPNIKACKSFESQTVELENVQLLSRVGSIPVLDSNESMNCENLRYRLESFADSYNDALPEIERLEKSQYEEFLELHNNTQHDNLATLFLPLESLLFLLTVGDYVDLSREMLFEIKQDNGSGEKLMIFQKPLPARDCGWHTNVQMVEQAFVANISLNKGIKKLRIVGDNFVLQETETPPLIDGTLNSSKQWKLRELKDLPYKKRTDAIKINSALVSWRLKLPETETHNSFEIFTSLQVSPALNETASKLLGSFALKLEYKPQYGCEIMTKYELLKAWFQLRMLRDSKTTCGGRCLRISAVDFKIQLSENVTLERIEQQLIDIYEVDMPKLLTSLSEFLSILSKIQTGTYLLRYSPKFSEQLLICAPTTTVLQNTIVLHDLLKVKPSDWEFMLEDNFLPIADNLCSVVHLYHTVLPCMFPPLLPHQKILPLSKLEIRALHAPSHREKVLENIRKQQEFKGKRFNRVRKHNRVRKSRRTKHGTNAGKKEQDLAQEIEMDNALFNF